MLIHNSGVLASRGTEGGRVTKTTAAINPVTVARMDAMNELNEVAKIKGLSVDEIVSSFLTSPKVQEQLIYYVRSKYESTMRDPLKLAMQAMLLRFRDVATIAKALNISDAEALVEVENAEYQAITSNTADAGVLSSDVQAALVVSMDEFIAAANRKGVAASSADMYSKIISIVGDNYDASLTPILQMDSPADNADGGINLGDFRPDAGSVNTSGVYGSSSAGSDSSSDSGGGFFDTLGSIFGAINSAIGIVKSATGAVSGAANTTTGAINQVGGALNNQVSSIGGNAINKSSLPWIIGGGILLIIVVIVIIYVAKRK